MTLLFTSVHLILTESKQQVTGKIPENGNACCYEFGHIEVLFALVVYIVEHGGVDAETDEGHHDKFAVLDQYPGVVIVKCPDPVNEVIGGGRDSESHGIREIFMGLQHLLEKISDTEIDDHADKAGHAET